MADRFRLSARREDLIFRLWTFGRCPSQNESSLCAGWPMKPAGGSLTLLRDRSSSRVVSGRPRRAVLLVLLHHIIFDEWSRPLLIREVGEIYQAYDQGQPSSLAELPIQYAEYAHWHRDWLRDEALEQEISYWVGQLEESPLMLNLPTDRPRPPVMTYEGDALPLVVPEALTEKSEKTGHAQRGPRFS
jgi:hypothetical protein